MMKMKFKIKRGGIAHRLAAMFLPMAVISLCSCSQEEPVAPVQEPTSENIENPLTRSPQEAVAIAEQAWQEFYGSDASASRSSSAPLIDLSRPVEVVRGTQSRGSSDADTLMYVVNFTDDAGFAIVAAPRNKEALLAVTSQGHYYPESMPDEELIPGFELWMENVDMYLKSNNEAISRGDISIGGGGLTPIKEWDDTIVYRKIDRQLNNTWGQGNNVLSEYMTYIDSEKPEGAYFSNGLCGCGPLAIAEVGLVLKRPSSINMDKNNSGEQLTLDWNRMSRHKMFKYSFAAYGECDEPAAEQYETHRMLAKMLRAIANKTDAVSVPGETTVTMDNMHKAALELFGSNNVSGWNLLNINTNFQNKEMLVVSGRSTADATQGHAWVCDGLYYLVWDRYAEIPNQYGFLETHYQGRQISAKLHFNWGWYGDCDGWYYNVTPSGEWKEGGTFSYKDLRYLKIK